jgi:hypothetical protein
LLNSGRAAARTTLRRSRWRRGDTVVSALILAAMTVGVGFFI